MKHLKSITLIFSMLKLLLLLAGCHRTPSETGLLIIGVEGLKSEDLACETARANEFRGFNFLCQNFVPVYGVVSNSTATASNMASLLTGLPPDQHQLRVNDQSLSSSHILLPEKLLTRGWKTSFFSAGAPLLRRTQLNQGFETFDEALPLSPQVPHRSFEQSALPFLSWLKEARGKHFAVITANDLLYPEVTNVSDKGEPRSRSLEGQLEEFDESLYHFFEELDRTEFGQRSWILLLGLSGRPDPRDPTMGALQLNPSQMLVPLFIRPPLTVTERPEDIRGLWTHAQLGEFLNDLANEIDTPPARRTTSPFQILKDRELPFVRAEACLLGNEDQPECRTAYFDEVAWLPWRAPLPTDLPARRALLSKIRKSGHNDPPARWSPLTLTTPRARPLEDCLNKFDEENFGTFQRLCQSKSILLLKSLSRSRQEVQSRPENQREQRVRFLYEWNQLASAHHLDQKFRPQGLMSRLRPEPSEEFLTVQTLLERPEFRDLQRETQRSREKF